MGWASVVVLKQIDLIRELAAAKKLLNTSSFGSMTM
jgi:hypothetical protein